ncbi:MAG: altronate dehydratase family protein [Turicibacter sp.]|nr:altronate dehydratase family protein [Turicibacter sp.]
MADFRINASDNVAVVMDEGGVGEIPFGHKRALVDIKSGENVIKYGFPIGRAVADIAAGEHIHVHNIKTNLSGVLDYEYKPISSGSAVEKSDLTFMGFRRKDGSVGIRNEVWIVNTVGCVNKIAERIAAEVPGTFTFSHPYGCSQLGEDHGFTQTILRGLVNHPNAGGVLVLGLGCENNNLAEFKRVLGDYDEERVRFLNSQDVDDEIAAGVAIVRELRAFANGFNREPVPLGELVIGLKCGGSDALSGITANPLVGRLSDKIIASGGSCLLTEVPEMFGAETLLMDRCVDKKIFDKTVNLINNFKGYFIRHNQEVYENPSPGNKDGGITTLEEKSLGCTQKGGESKVVDVLAYGERVKVPGLSLLDGPGNDIVAVTNLTAVGAHMVLFTTGRGTPLGGPVPTVKVASNRNLAHVKANWIDFNADKEDLAALDAEFLRLIVEVASGREVKNEVNGYREIAIFKDGVTL